jgi:hypothetical protein
LYKIRIREDNDRDGRKRLADRGIGLHNRHLRDFGPMGMVNDEIEIAPRLGDAVLHSQEAEYRYSWMHVVEYLRQAVLGEAVEIDQSNIE